MSHERPVVRIGRILIEAGVLTREDVTHILEIQETTQPYRKFLDLAIYLGRINRPQANNFLEIQRTIHRLIPVFQEARRITDEQLHTHLQSTKQKWYRGIEGVCYGGLQEISEFLASEANVRTQRREIYIVSRRNLSAIEAELFPGRVLIPVEAEELPFTIFFRDSVILVAVDDLSARLYCELVLDEASHIQSQRALEAIYTHTRPNLSVSYGDGILGEYVKVNDMDLGEQKDDLEIVYLVNHLLQEGMRKGASDLHIEPQEYKVRVRYRVDGILHYYTDLPLSFEGRLITRLKVLCDLNISEHRRHQDGKIRAIMFGEEIDIRVSTYVSEFGENTVMRYLPKATGTTLEQLGIAPVTLRRYRDIIMAPSGIVLITGPTGSGKSTTLYSSAKELNTYDRKLISIEDPVEYTIPGVVQGGVNDTLGVDYSTSLKAILRQDPDVIMVGEIRDRRSAEAAVQAGLTGHKIFTTFHTDDTTGALLRLMDMGIDTFLISSTVVSVMSQRLVRKNCRMCLHPAPFDPHVAKRYHIMGLENYVGYKGKGCTYCNFTGYDGRIVITELLVLNDAIRNAILEKKTSGEIRRIARRSTHFVTLREDGAYKALMGLTTLEEVLRVVFHSEYEDLESLSVEEICTALHGPDALSELVSFEKYQEILLQQGG